MGSSGRYEIKAVYRSAELHVIRARIRMHPAAFRKHHPNRQVNNLYFDSHAFSCVADNLAGIDRRLKLRLRWYGKPGEAPGLTASEVRLELKRKFGLVGQKQVVELGPPLDLSMPWRDVMRDLRARDLGILHPFLAAYSVPVFYNRYERAYYISADERLRLTIDTRLVDIRQQGSRPWIQRHMPARDAVVVELKASIAHTDAVRDAAATLPFDAVAFSKYTTGMIGSNSADRGEAPLPRARGRQ